MKPVKYLPLLIASGGISAVNAQPQLEEIVITASRTETPIRSIGASVSVIDSAAIDLRGYDNVTDLLRTQMSVGASNSGGPGKATSVRIRGEEGYRTMVLIDGLDVSDPSGTQVMPQMQHLGGTGILERVELLRGPQGFVYGADAGGVISLFTREAQKFEAQLSAEAGAYNSRELQGYMANGGEHGNFLTAISHQKTDGLNARTDDTTGEKDGYENTTAHLKGRFNWNENWYLQGVARNTDATNEYDSCWAGSCMTDNYDDFNQVSGRVELGFDSKKSKQHLALNTSQTQREYFAAGTRTYVAEGTLNKAEYLGSYAFNQAVKLVWGTDYETQELERSDHKSSQLGVYTEAQTRFGRNAYLSAGVRFDDNDSYGEHTSVRVSPAYVIPLSEQQALKLRASYGSGFRAPSLSELAENEDPESNMVALSEETSEGFDVGIEWYRGAALSVTLGYFNQKVEDEIYYDLVSYSGYFQDEGTSRSKGVEFSFEYAPVDALVIAGNYTHNEAENADHERRARRPKHLANASVTGFLMDNRLRLMTNLRGARDAVDTDGEPLSNYALVDISGQFDITRAFEVFVRVENALDKDYTEARNYNTAERAVYGGLKYTF